MSTQTLSVVLSLLMGMFVIELVRREKLTFKYAAGWLLLSGAGVVLAIFHEWLDNLSAFLGFALTSNFIFFTMLCGFVFLSLSLTIFLCQQNSRNDRIAQKLGLLEEELALLKSELKKKG